MCYLIKDKLSKSKFIRQLLLKIPDSVLRMRKLREIIIEPTNFCNLRCPFCINSRSQREKGRMSLNNFKRLVSMLPRTIDKVTLHFAGEPFMNPYLPDMIGILNKRGVKTTLSTNGTLPFTLYKRAIDAGLDLMLIALDGPTKELHEKYRVGSNFDEIINTIQKLTSLPERKTKIVIQFLVMRHNEELIPEMKKLCDELGVDELWLKTTSFNIASDEEMEKKVLRAAKEYLPLDKKYSRYAIKNNKLVNTDKPKVCNWFWKTVILWNGDVSICCTDLEGNVIVGNVFKERSFEKIWRSDKYAKIRKKIISQDLKICQSCNIANKPYVEKIKFN